jgi:protease-4
MVIKHRHLIYILLFFLFPGCAFVNMSLVPQQKGLKEKVIEGKGQPKILLLDISGFISERERSDRLGVFRRPSLVEQVKEALRMAERDDEIAGLIVKINSPGGLVTATDIIYHELVRFKEKKKIPLYASIMSVGASGGYYVANATDMIIAHPTAITGSIGVISLKFNIEGLLDKIGVEEETYKSGDKKDIFSPFRPRTPEEREIIQGIIDTLYGRFLDTVYARRKGVLTMEELKILADGRVYTADQALDVRLIDAVGYLDDAIGFMKASLGIAEARVVTYYRSGEYKGSIYSAYPDKSSPVLDLFAGDMGSFAPLAGVEFMYLWIP